MSSDSNDSKVPPVTKPFKAVVPGTMPSNATGRKTVKKVFSIQLLLIDNDVKYFLYLMRNSLQLEIGIWAPYLKVHVSQSL